MFLEEIADITQGSILTRIKDTSGTAFKAFTMQQLSYYINASDTPGLFNEIVVNNDKIGNLCIAKENDILVGLASGKAMKVSKEDDGCVVLSNFIRIRLKDVEKFDPDFICWIFNENLYTQKYFASQTQGSARVSIIPLSFIKCLNVDLIPFEQQKKIGRIYQLQKEKVKLVLKKEKIKSAIIGKELFEIYKNHNMGEK